MPHTDRTVADVAFDDFVFTYVSESDDGQALLEIGRNAADDTIAVVSLPWPTMPVVWLALQSRHGANVLGVDDEMEPVGHRAFDDTYAVDADDASEFRRLFRTSLRTWLVELDDEHGPLVMVFDGGQPIDDSHLRIRTDVAGAGTTVDGTDVVDTSPIFCLARPTSDSEHTNDTRRLGLDVLEHLRSVFGS